MRENEELKLEGPELPSPGISRVLRESSPSVRQSIEDWLRQSLAAKKARETRMEELHLYLASTRDDRERRLREQAEAWERKKAALEDRVDILGLSLETPGEILKAEASVDVTAGALAGSGLLRPSDRAREALNDVLGAEDVVPLIRTRA